MAGIGISDHVHSSPFAVLGVVRGERHLKIDRQRALDVLASKQAKFVSFLTRCGFNQGGFGAQALYNSVRHLDDLESVTLPTIYLNAATHLRAPSVRWYFDEDLTQTSADCDGSASNIAYIVAENFDAAFTSVEYRVAYPRDVQVIAEFGVNAWQLNVGVTQLGVVSTWSHPMNGYSPVVIMWVLYDWVSCGNCNSGANQNQPIFIEPHPESGQLSFTRVSGERVDAVGMTSLVCPSSIFPVEQTTWGKVKALYR
ncbi:MAG: hypothetical protein IH969_01290 [Candidatus Krumholzibacteriota bacterium]|nr:hypothetical protein [Candidatus Krumholzibacteriota bacterium]